SHYVLSNSGRLELEALTSLQRYGLPGEGEASTQPAVPLGNLPCSGPSCSRGAGVPFVPATTASTLRHEPWCCATAGPPSCGADLGDALMEPTPARPRRRADALERPPRSPV
ncbi:MAG TPA: hypothetical protein VGZ22_10365, partial [Isosphaeraceae bacterium]|nr:hypothetical protein [Isosphaeraceae bacterium]